jgi:hypothetical protein
VATADARNGGRADGTPLDLTRVGDLPGCSYIVGHHHNLVEVRREGTQLFYSLADGFNGMASRVHAAVDSIRKVSPKAPKVRRP